MWLDFHVERVNDTWSSNHHPKSSNLSSPTTAFLPVGPTFATRALTAMRVGHLHREAPLSEAASPLLEGAEGNGAGRMFLRKSHSWLTTERGSGSRLPSPLAPAGKIASDCTCSLNPAVQNKMYIFSHNKLLIAALLCH